MAYKIILLLLTFFINSFLINKAFAHNQMEEEFLENFICIVSDISIIKKYNNDIIYRLQAGNKNIDITGDGKSNYFELLDKEKYIELNIEEVFGTEYLLQYYHKNKKIKIQNQLFSLNSFNDSNISYIMHKDSSVYILNTEDNNFSNIKLEKITNKNSNQQNINTVNISCTRLNGSSLETKLVEKLKIRNKLSPAFTMILNFN